MLVEQHRFFTGYPVDLAACGPLTSTCVFDNDCDHRMDMIVSS